MLVCPVAPVCDVRSCLDILLAIGAVSTLVEPPIAVIETDWRTLPSAVMDPNSFMEPVRGRYKKSLDWDRWRILRVWRMRRINSTTANSTSETANVTDNVKMGTRKEPPSPLPGPLGGVAITVSMVLVVCDGLVVFVVRVDLIA